MHNWFYHPVVHDVEKTDFYVKDLPFPAVTICSNNKIVKRQLESVLLTQPWKGYNKKIKNFDKDFESALTSLVLATENPKSLSHLSQGAIDIVNKYKDSLPDVMKKVQNNWHNHLLFSSIMTNSYVKIRIHHFPISLMKT